MIPCCREKYNIPVQGDGKPLGNIHNLRSQLLDMIKHTSDLASKRENKNGVLNPMSSTTQAIELYKGNFYKVAGESLKRIMAGVYPSVHVLIVSAFYGLARLNENLKQYELQMGDRLINGMAVHKFWQHHELWKILSSFIHENNITHVWSVLPDSSPHFPYHRVFSPLWKQLGNTKTKCFHLKVPGAGVGIGFKRAQWLENVININPNYLLCEPFPPPQFDNITGYRFEYVPC